jgi:3'-5' exoribonuclease
MAEMMTANSAVTHDVVPQMLPAALRIQSIHRAIGAEHRIQNEAVLFHEKACLKVSWATQHVDVRLHVGSVVAIRWTGHPKSVNGCIHVARLMLLERPDPALNLFDTVPTQWVRDRDLLSRARALWEQLPRGMQHLLNALLWEGNRFHRYVVGPSSLNGHHNGWNGNFRHSVEVAETAVDMGSAYDTVFSPLLILGGLLHDVGKADEYQYDYARRCFEMSPRGALVGHRNTVLEWLAVARSQYRVILPDEHYLGLIHAMTATRGGERLGLREPVSLEAAILSAADRLSGEANLVERLAPFDSGFGRYHKHLRGRPYVVRQGDSASS